MSTTTITRPLPSYDTAPVQPGWTATEVEPVKELVTLDRAAYASILQSASLIGFKIAQGFPTTDDALICDGPIFPLTLEKRPKDGRVLGLFADPSCVILGALRGKFQKEARVLVTRSRKTGSFESEYSWYLQVPDASKPSWMPADERWRTVGEGFLRLGIETLKTMGALAL